MLKVRDERIQVPRGFAAPTHGSRGRPILWTNKQYLVEDEKLDELSRFSNSDRAVDTRVVALARTAAVEALHPPRTPR
jgi:hypothetical protein